MMSKHLYLMVDLHYMLIQPHYIMYDSHYIMGYCLYIHQVDMKKVCPDITVSVFFIQCLN